MGNARHFCGKGFLSLEKGASLAEVEKKNHNYCKLICTLAVYSKIDSFIYSLQKLVGYENSPTFSM